MMTAKTFTPTKSFDSPLYSKYSNLVPPEVLTEIIFLKLIYSKGSSGALVPSGIHAVPVIEHSSEIQNFAEMPNFDKIQNLVTALSELDDVKEVRAVAHKPNDLHNVRFKLLVDVNADDELDDVGCLWEKAERMAYQARRELRKATEEEWHFNAELVKEFESIDNELLITSILYAQTKCSS